MNNFKKLRPFLPKRYTAELAQRVGNVTSMEIRKAFAGQLGSEEKVARILAKATEWAEERKKEGERVKMKVKRVTSKARKRA